MVTVGFGLIALPVYAWSAMFSIVAEEIDAGLMSKVVVMLPLRLPLPSMATTAVPTLALSL